jgi:glycolate oxidase FAD binding subunit
VSVAAPTELRPADSVELARHLREADSNGEAVVPEGAGAQQYVGNPPRRMDVLMRTTRLDGVIEHTPADLTVTVGAGTPLAKLQAHLARAGQHLPLDPPHGDVATIGGIIATNASGPRRQRHGTLRDLLIGTRTALVDGTIARAGGKVVKNVAGYDLNKLLIGSLGTLGVVVEATFKVLPLPSREGALVARFRTQQEAFAAAVRIARSPLRPTTIEVLDSGSAELVVAAEGETAALRRTLDDAARAARESGATATEIVDDVERALAPSRGLLERPAAVVRASLPLTAQAAYVAQVRRVAAERECTATVAAHAGAGIVRAKFAGEDEAVRRAVPECIACAAPLEGDAYAERLPPALHGVVDAWQGEPAGFFLMRRIKEEFDPRNTLNPGRFVGGI